MFPNDITVSQNKTELIFIRYRNKNINSVLFWDTVMSFGNILILSGLAIKPC